MKIICKNKLEIDGVLKKNKFWVEGWFERGLAREMRVFEKLSHLLPKKLKTRIFHGLDGSEIVVKKSRDILKLSQEALSRKPVAIASV